MLFFRTQKKLFPPKGPFLPIYIRQAAFAVEASEALHAMMQTGDQTEWRRLEKEVKQCEVQGDAMLSEFYEELCERVMPPMKRSDFQHMAMEIDEFIDSINTAAKSMMLYSPEKIDPQLLDMAQYIEDEANALKMAVSLMDDAAGNFSAVTLQCDRITELEHAADDSYEEYIGYIFREQKNPIELMKYKNIAEALESSTDAAKKISDRIRNFLIRYV